MRSGIYAIKGNIYYKLKDFQSAINEYKIAIELNLKLSDRMNEAKNRFNLGNTYMKIDNYNNAIMEIQNVYRQVKNIDNITLFKKYSLLLSILYIRKGRLKDALEILRLLLLSYFYSGNDMEGRNILNELKDEEIDSLFKKGIELILKAQERFRFNYAYGYLSMSLFITSLCFKRLKNTNLYLNMIRMIEGLISLIDKNDIPNFLQIIKNFLGVERAAMILKQDKVYGNDVDDVTISDVKEISRSAIKLAEKGKILLSYNAGKDIRFMDKRSVFLNKIKSILCVPIISNENIRGILYLDSTIKNNLFDEMDSLLNNALSFYGMVGVSDKMKDIFEKVKMVAPLNLNILITGETGTGKNMLAEIIHQLSERRNEKFVTVECTTIPQELMRANYSVI